MSSAFGFASTSSNRCWCSSASTTIGSRPFFRALFRKMSANDVERIARIPHAVSAHGACSRDEPVPKLSPTSRICRSSIATRSITNSGSLSAAVLVVAPVVEEGVARGRPCRSTLR